MRKTSVNFNPPFPENGADFLRKSNPYPLGAAFEMVHFVGF